MAAYQQNNWKPFFINGRFEPTDRAKDFLQRLQNLENEAIDPTPYDLEGVKVSMRNLEQVRLSLLRADPYLCDSRADSSETGQAASSGSPGGSSTSNPKYAMNSPAIPSPDQSSGRERELKYKEIFRTSSELDLRLTKVFTRFAQEMNPYSGNDQVKALLGDIPFDKFLKDLEPSKGNYWALVAALERYRTLASQNTQVLVGEQGSLRPGDSGNAVRNLQKRLQQEEFYGGKITGSFDSATKEAVQQFQRAHVMDADGAVGQRTKDWLNVPFAQKAEMIAQNLRLLRQSETRQYERFVRINIPDYKLEYYNDGKIKAVHRVVVGKATGKRVKLQGRWMGENQTPPISSTIEQVVFNPKWYVTDRIRLELNDLAGSDPDYFSKHGYVEMASHYPGGQPRLFQLPGPNNALGRVRFDFPNPYAVYMHDTPLKHLFHRTRRDFSHGCVRVEKARELAEVLLSEDQNPSARKIDSLLATNRETFVKLSQPLPIVIEYLPISIEGKDRIVFCGDPYGWFKENSSRKS